jgi:hypothetical protein
MGRTSIFQAMAIQIKTPHKLADYDVPGARFNPTQLVLAAGLPEEDWQAIGRTLVNVNQASYFWLGDWILYGTKLYGVQTAYDLAAQATGLSRQVLRGAARCARSYLPADRFPSLSFHHHATLEKYPPQVRTKLLKEAEELGLTSRQVRKMAEEECGTEKPNTERKSVVVRLWPETIDRLKEMAGRNAKLDWFLTRIVEDWLRWRGESNCLREKRTTAEQRTDREAQGLCIMCGTRPGDNEKIPTERYPEGRAVRNSKTCRKCRELGQARYHRQKLFLEAPTSGSTLAIGAD